LESFHRTHLGKRAYLNDVAVPISVYPELIAFIHRLQQRVSLPAYLIGHVSNGNIHIIFPFGDDEEYQIAEDLNAQVVEKAISLGGTATGEHGVGIGKSRFMAEEHGAAFALMRHIKDLLDPHGILNPAKIFGD